MSKIAAGLSKVSGIAASVLAFIPGGQPFAAAASAISAGAGAVASLTAKPPAPPSQLEDVTFGADQPMAYALGRCELIGQLVHSEAHGQDREDVPNPWRTDTIVLTGGGPVVAIDNFYANKNEVTFDVTSGWETGYYDKYLRHDSQLGLTPETTGMSWVANDPGSPPTFDYWTGTRLISGSAAMQFGMLLDSEETHFRSGAPKFSAVGRWTKHYDPRLDDTYSGGVGTHRLGTESTYEYTTNGVLQALTYAYGRYQNGKLVLGGGLPVTSIDIDSFVTAANTAEANGWTCNGVVFENGEDGEIWNNMKLMLQTAAAWPTNDGGVLRCLQRRAVVTLDTIVEDDLEGACVVKGMTDWKDGFNTIIPTIVSEANEWAEVPIDAVAVDTLIASQGESRPRSRTYKLVTDADQAAALAALDIYDSVEIDPISLTVGRRFISYDVGDAFDTDLPDLGLVGVTVVLLSKKIELSTGRVILGIKTDTTAKHDYALGLTNSAPPQPALATNAELDQASREVTLAPLRAQALTESFVSDMTGGITATETATGVWTITANEHSRTYSNPTQFPAVTVDEADVAGLASSTTYYLYYDDPLLEGGAQTLVATTDQDISVRSQSNPYRHRVGIKTTPADGGADTAGTPTPPPGYDGSYDGEGSIP
jgi:hypothetical protein